MERARHTCSDASDRLYRILLELYADSYLDAHRDEMLADYERLKLDFDSPLALWAFIVKDLGTSLPSHYMETIRRSRPRNRLTIAAAILLAPIFAVCTVDLVSRIVAGDLSHPNKSFYQSLARTWLYAYPVLFTWVVLFPALAFVLASIALIRERRGRSLVSWPFIKSNAIGIMLAALALGFLALVKLHDFAPCVARHVLSEGVGGMGAVIDVCRNA